MTEGLVRRLTSGPELDGRGMSSESGKWADYSGKQAVQDQGDIWLAGSAGSGMHLTSGQVRDQLGM